MAVAGCSDNEPDHGDSPDDGITLGVRREVPLDDPCQWLTSDTAADALAHAGADIGPDGVHIITNAIDLGDLGADCWYQSKAAGAFLNVTLLDDSEAAANWRKGMEDLAKKGGTEESGDKSRAVVRVADAPTLQQSTRTTESANCDVHALTGEDAVVAVSLSVDGAPDADALCADARDVLVTVIERLPESG